MAKDKPEKRLRLPGSGLAATVMLFFMTAFLLLFLRDFAWQGLALAAAVPLGIWIGTHVICRSFHVDMLLLTLTNFLCALGILVLYDTNKALAYHQAMYYGIGLAAMIACIYLVRWTKSVKVWRYLTWPMGLVSLRLLALPLLIGRETNGAKNWIYLGSGSVQPSEIVKISLLILVCHFMSRRQMLPWLVFSVGCLGILMLQKDLGTALLYYGVTLMLYFASSSNVLLTALGLGGGVGAAVMGYRMFAHVKKRVAIWKNPFEDNDHAGYQIVQGLMALASGGLVGVGLGLGSPTTIPVYQTDFIFAVICEQFGLVFGLFVLAMYVAIIWRGAVIARGARRSFHGLLAMGATLMIALQTFVIIGGVIKMIPLTGVTMPFVSSGGSSLVSSMCLIGLVQGVESLNRDDLTEDERMTEMQQTFGGKRGGRR